MSRGFIDGVVIALTFFLIVFGVIIFAKQGEINLNSLSKSTPVVSLKITVSPSPEPTVQSSTVPSPAPSGKIACPPGQVQIYEGGQPAGCDTPASVDFNGDISVTPDRSSYKVNETVNVKILNGTQNTFYTTNFGSYCKIVKIESKSDSWKETGTCGSAQPLFSVAIKPGTTSVAFTFPTTNGYPVNLQPGTYRIRLDYSNAPDNYEWLRVYSKEFYVN